MSCSFEAYWTEWQISRVGEYIEDGMPSHLAVKIAAAEAKYRSRIAKVIGNAAAEVAQLFCIRGRYGLKFFIQPDLGGLSDREIDQLMAKPVVGILANDNR